MRIAILILTLLAFAAVSPAHAAPDKTPPGPGAPHGPTDAGKPDASPKPEAPPKPDKPEEADKPDKAGKADRPEKPDKAALPGPGPADPVGASNGTGGSAATTPFDPVDQDEALRAVERHEALPLAHIVTIAEGQPAGGHVINARLVRVQNFLLYQLTMLDDTGRSWRDYYYARSGNPVEID